jgi:RIO kinase 1
MTQDEIIESLDSFFADGLVVEFESVVKSGKEATVVCCRAGHSLGGGMVAAKVYRPLENRNFHNDAMYLGGRTRVMTRRDRLAFNKRTRHGMDVRFRSWIDSEYQTLAMLHEAGSDVPRPLARSARALLMEFIGGQDGPAPMLSAMRLERDDSERILRALMRNVALWLRHHVVHGDLSPYNILLRGQTATVIDFPQAVDARMNPNARGLLDRDLENLCGYFARQGVSADPRHLARELWSRYRDGGL